jgi:hypothetical protein
MPPPIYILDPFWLPTLYEEQKRVMYLSTRTQRGLFAGAPNEHIGRRFVDRHRSRALSSVRNHWRKRRKLGMLGINSPRGTRSR